MRYPWNETINAFRWALKGAYEEVLKFDASITPEDFHSVVEALLYERGVETDGRLLGHDPALYGAVRRRLGWDDR